VSDDLEVFELRGGIRWEATTPTGFVEVTTHGPVKLDSAECARLAALLYHMAEVVENDVSMFVFLRDIMGAESAQRIVKDHRAAYESGLSS